MKLLKDFIITFQILPYLNELNIPQTNSNRGYDPTILILGFWFSIIKLEIDFLTQIGFVMIQHCNQYLN